MVLKLVRLPSEDSLNRSIKRLCQLYAFENVSIKHYWSVDELSRVLNIHPNHIFPKLADPRVFSLLLVDNFIMVHPDSAIYLAKKHYKQMINTDLKVTKKVLSQLNPLKSQN